MVRLFTVITLSWCLLAANAAFADTSSSPDGIWAATVPQQQQKGAGKQPWIQPDTFKLFSLNQDKLEAALEQAPAERAARPAAAYIDLPTPDGSYARFEFVEAPVMEPELAAKYPDIKTYLGKRVDRPTVWARFDWTPAGFHAQVIDPDNSIWYVDPYIPGESYVSYYKRDYHPTGKNFSCSTPGGHDLEHVQPKAASRSGDNLRTYRIAVACTGEYGQFHGGTNALALAAIVTTINRVTGIYEYELAVRLILVANNDAIVYVNPATDPFTGNNNADTLIEESQTVIDAGIGSSNYDIGHTFSTGAGGLAYGGVVCVANWKAKGVTGSSSPVGDAYDVDYVAHEIGHQFSAMHTFNGAFCSSRYESTAYEPGSGSTIMAYAGICGSDDLQPHSDPLFHSVSHEEILNYITVGDGNTCGTVTSLSNAVPEASAGADFTIPAQTPFVLTGSATDSDGDALVYLWEERDLGPQAALSAADDGAIPLFRVYTASSSMQRYLPRLPTLVSNSSDHAEKLPQLARTMDFLLTVRDGKGGVDSDDMQVTVDSTSGPFRVTYPNSSTTFLPNSQITVTWDTANSNNAPVNAANVDIFLSTDGGLTWDMNSPLLAATANDGSEVVTLPNIGTSTARIMVKAAGNIFFDISDQNFTTTSSSALPAILDLLL